MSGGPLLAIENLSLEIAHRQRTTVILRGIDLQVAGGNIHAIVGESGAGKTMVAKAIMGLLPDGARVTSGDIRFDGQSLLGMNESQRRSLLGRSISMIMQNPMTALNPVMRIGKQMTAILRRHMTLNDAAARRLALSVLSAVGIREPERVVRLYPHELSGGMCQRVLVSLAFACEPRLIIADEPTTALDVTVQRQVLRIIKELQSRTGVAVIFVTHDLGVVAKLCDGASVMFAGRIVETASVENLLTAPRHEYTKALFAATPRYDRPDAALRPIPTALRERLWKKPAPTTWPVSMYEVRDVRLALPDRTGKKLIGPAPKVEILKGVSLVVAAGETLGIVGESGSGKSTLARTMLRIYRPSAGSLRFEGLDITDLPESRLRPLRARMQIIFQDSQSSLNPRLRIGASLMEPLRSFRRAASHRAALDAATSLLDKVGLPENFMRRYPHQLSGGQRQRIGIARALALGPSLVVADEIVSGLDVSVQAQILALLRDIQAATGMALVLISHDLSVVRAVCDRIAVMRSGNLVETAASRELFDNPQHPYTRKLLRAIPLLRSTRPG